MRVLVAVLLAGAVAGAAACASTGTEPAPARRPSARARAPRPGDPVGWASIDDLDQDGTTGGGDLPPVVPGTLADLQRALNGNEPRVVRIMGTVSGAFDVGSNKTIEGTVDAELHGHLELGGSVNVIVRNLRIVGYNCADKSPCKNGYDAVSITEGAHHVWFDHCDISDGSDGNLDINDGADDVTISWTKFSYSVNRPGGHQFSNLLSSSDGAESTDAGHIQVTFHHDWWADHVEERMPRVRFGKVHVYNNLYTSSDAHYCVGLGADASLLVENNVFAGRCKPLETEKYASEKSTILARGNVAENTGAVVNIEQGTAFTPPYPYVLDPASAVRSAVMRSAGPR